MSEHMLEKVYSALFHRWGPQHWWPADSPLEMMIGAILTQNTAWTNVEKSIGHLKEANAIQLDVLKDAPLEQIAGWIRPAGYFNVKAEYIKGMTQTIMDRFHGSIDNLFALETPVLRNELLSWKGIGPETADSILLYAANRPVFVVDAYTKRICTRHGWIEETTKYDEVAQFFTTHLPQDIALFNEYHALIVRLGKDHCNTQPKCSGCPLEPFFQT